MGVLIFGSCGAPPFSSPDLTEMKGGQKRKKEKLPVKYIHTQICQIRETGHEEYGNGGMEKKNVDCEES